MPNPVLDNGEFILLYKDILGANHSDVHGKMVADPATGKYFLHIKIAVHPVMVSTQDGTPIPSTFWKGAIFNTTGEQCQLGFPGFTLLSEDPTDLQNTNVRADGLSFSILTGGKKVEHADTLRSHNIKE